MVSINKSFVYGVGFASVTWIVSLYLFLQLTKQENNESLQSLSQITNGKNSIIADKFNKLNEKYRNMDKSYMIKGGGKNPIKEIFNKKTRKNISVFDEELLTLGLVTNTTDKKLKEEGYKIFAFNVLISNRLSYNRTIPDTRNELCKNHTFEQDLPSASIVICFYNEHFHTLIRSVQSILNRTPRNLLHEIILVDDFSDIEHLHENITKYLMEHNEYKIIKLFKTERREGLIRARIFGARRAKGQVLIFLDSHIEVNIQWIEPLLTRIKEQKSNVVMPIIDIINPDTFAYTSSPLVRGGFNWGLHFKWENVPKGQLSKAEDLIKPIKSPTMAGGLFAIDRQYFIDMGEYDAGMNIWGGENLEISFRIWMCGGSLELIPCSRIGHVFRNRRPYSSPDGEDTMLYNSLRVANVWMDDYKKYYFSQSKRIKNEKYGDINSRIQLRKDLKCHNFEWYLKNVYPELILPSDDKERVRRKWTAIESNKYQPWHSRRRNYIDQFQIRLKNSSLCIQSAKNLKVKKSLLILKPCIKNNKKQRWYETDKNELVLAQLLCLQASTPTPILQKCHELGADQEWKHKGGKNSPIYNLAAGMCLGVNEKKIDATVQMKFCTNPDLNTWDLI